MSEQRTWCGIHRCFREANHPGACEVDELELDYNPAALAAPEQELADDYERNEHA